MSSPRQRAQGPLAASVPSKIKKQIPPDFRQRKDRRVAMNAQHGSTKSCLTNPSALGDEMTVVWMNRRVVDGVYLNFKVPVTFCRLLAAKLVSCDLQRNLR